MHSARSPAFREFYNPLTDYKSARPTLAVCFNSASGRTVFGLQPGSVSGGCRSAETRKGTGAAAAALESSQQVRAHELRGRDQNALSEVLELRHERAAPYTSGAATAASSPAGDDFILDWLDVRIGSREARRVVVAYVAPAISGGRAEAPADPEAAWHSISLFRRRAGVLARLGGADIITRQPLGMLVGWHWRGSASLPGIHRTVRMLARLQCLGGAVSCAIAVGQFLVDAKLGAREEGADGLLGGPLLQLISQQATAGGGEVHELASFAELRGAPSGHGIGKSNPTSVSRAEAEIEAAFFSLGRIRRLASVAAVAGMECDAALVAEIISADRDMVAGALQRLADLRLMTHFSVRHGGCFRFDDALVHQVAYAAIPARVRQRLHLAAAHALSAMPDQQPLRHRSAIAVATHFAEAGSLREAADWWRMAAMDAVVRSTPDQAIAILETAYRDLKTANGPVSRARWTDICRLLGTQLATVRGNAAPEVLAAYRHCLDGLPAAHGHAPPEFDAIWGVLGVHLTRGETAEAVLASRQLLALSRSQGDPARAMLAHRMIGLTELLLGNLSAARFHLVTALDLFDPKRDAALRYSYGSDQLAVAHTHLALMYAYLGDSAEADRHANHARSRMAVVRHAHTTAHVTGVLSLAYDVMGRRREASLMELGTSTVARFHGLPYWTAWAGIMRATGQLHEDPARALRELRQATAQYEATGARQLVPFALAKTAEACLRLGLGRQAESEAAAALACLQRTGIRLFEPHVTVVYARSMHATGRPVEAGRLHARAARSARRMRMRAIADTIENDLAAAAARAGDDPASLDAERLDPAAQAMIEAP
jgi:tetratricopeptide (TPR) repeat protein